METVLLRARCAARAWLWPLLCALALTLTGCGGGGASANNTSGGGDSGGGSGTVSTGAATLTGVVAVGTPVLGATVSVVDALGVDQGSAVTAISDGGYQLTLSTSSRTLPLFIQARGSDMQGLPVVMHTVVQSLNTGSTPNVIHLNPFTDAVVALLLGGDPRPYFQAPTAYAAWSLLGNRLALEAASLFLKTIISSNLADAGLTDLAAVNFFSSATFAANKTGLDGVLDGLRFRYQLTGGLPVLQISSRLATTGSTEVSINLSLAVAQLEQSTPAVAEDVIASLLTATTGRSGLMPNVSGLNALTATINLALAQNYAATALLNLPIFSASYDYFDGMAPLETATILAGYGASGYLLSPFQVVGCLDAVSSAGCDRVAVAALVRNAQGVVVDVMRNVASYDSSIGWRLRGNGRQTPWYIHPITWAEWDASGALDTSVSPNPGVGMQVLVSAREFMIATIQAPNGYTLTMNHCDTITWAPLCMGTTETGDLIDDQVFRSSSADWLGNIDMTPGASYRIQTVTLGYGSEDNTTLLSVGLPTVSASDVSAYPLPDNLSASSPLMVADLTGATGLTISWADWAAANPHLRMIEVRAVIRSTPPTAPVKASVTVMPLSATQATLPAFSTIPADAVSYHLWLVAQDTEGRRYVSKITAQP